MVNVNDGVVFNGQTKFVMVFFRTVKDNIAACYAVSQGFFVFKTADNFCPTAFLMENATNGIIVMRFVTPRKLHFWITCFKSPHCIAVILPDFLFAQHKNGRTIVLNQALDRHPVNVSNGGKVRFGTEFIHQTCVHFFNERSFIF